MFVCCQQTMETIYPKIAEGAGSALLTLLITIVQIVYLAVSFIPALASSTAWMNWLMVIVTPVCVMPLVAMRARYNRLADDDPSAVKKVGILDSFGCF